MPMERGRALLDRPQIDTYLEQVVPTKCRAILSTSVRPAGPGAAAGGGRRRSSSRRRSSTERACHQSLGIARSLQAGSGRAACQAPLARRHDPGATPLRASTRTSLRRRGSRNCACRGSRAPRPAGRPRRPARTRSAIAQVQPRVEAGCGQKRLTALNQQDSGRRGPSSARPRAPPGSRRSRRCSNWRWSDADGGQLARDRRLGGTALGRRPRAAAGPVPEVVGAEPRPATPGRRAAREVDVVGPAGLLPHPAWAPSSSALERPHPAPRSTGR